MNPRLYQILARLFGADGAADIMRQADDAGQAVASAPMRQMELPFDNLPAVSRNMPDAIQPPVRQGLDAMDVPPAAMSEPDFALDSPLFRQMHKADRAYDNLRRGRSANLWNQPFNAPAGAAIRDAAADSIRALQRDAEAEQLGRIAALAGAGGLGAMITESDARLRGNAPMVAADPASPVMGDPAQPTIDDLIAAMPDVAMDTGYDPVVTDTTPSAPPPDMLTTLGDPMATADLVAESRPLPASTPRMTPEEIESLRSQVVDIRDAATGQAMDSFYPPESEEYKAEQRAKKRYPQLRMR